MTPTQPRATRTRHGLPAAALLVAGAFALTACGVGSSPGSGATAAPSGTPATGSAAASAFPTSGSGTLNLYNWTDYISPDLLKRFTAETGIEVKLDTYDSNETLLAKIEPGNPGYDVIVPSDYMVKQMISQGLLEQVTPASFPNGGGIKPEFLSVYFDQGRQYTAPYMYGTTGIAYDPSQGGGATVDSWAQFFAPPAAYKGKVGTLNDQIEVVHAALRAVGAKPCSEDSADYARVDALLKAWKPDVAVVNSDNVIARMASGEQWMHMMWNGAFHRAKQDNAKLEYVYPKEGMTLWQDNLAIPKGAPNLDNAKIFLNWMMDPENIAEATNFVGYNNGITGSDAFFDAALKTDPAVNPAPEQAALATPVEACSTTANDLYTKVWENFRS